MIFLGKYMQRLVLMMNDDQARIVRIYQFLLSNGDFIRQNVKTITARVCRKKPSQDDVFALWYAMIKSEIWEEFAREVWKMLQ